MTDLCKDGGLALQSEAAVLSTESARQNYRLK